MNQTADDIFMHDDDSLRCRRCGICCTKGGPSLHREDRSLIDQGTIPCSRLFTIRSGEPVHDNIAGGVIPAETDLVKIKSAGKDWTCVFYDGGRKGCSIYSSRPLECRVLKCWDTTGIKAVYRSGRLSRKDLVGGIAGLWELVHDHQVRCGYDRIGELLPQVRQHVPAADEELRRMVLFDLNLRRLVVEKMPAMMGMTDFLLGRALIETLKPMGVTPNFREDRRAFEPFGAIG